MSDFLEKFKAGLAQAETAVAQPAPEAQATQPVEQPAQPVQAEQPAQPAEQAEQPSAEPAQQAAPAAQPSKNQPPQMVPVQRLAQATRAQKAAEQRYLQTQSELQGLKQELDALRRAAEQRQTPAQQAAAEAEGDDNWLERILDGDTPKAGLDKETVKHLQQLSKEIREVKAYQTQQVQIAREQAEDSALDGEMERLQQACPSLPEETAIAMYAAGFNTDAIIAQYRKMVPQAAPRQAAAPKAPAPPPPPQIAQPGTVAPATQQKMKWGDFVKTGLKQRLEAR